MNTTQGFFIFLFHVLLSKTKRNLWSKIINTNSCKLSKTTSNTTDNQIPSSNLKIGSFKQSININIDGNNTVNPSQIFVTNSNNIILNSNSINTSDDNNSIRQQEQKLNNQASSQQYHHHHYHHHHVHHIRKNQIKRKKQPENNDSNNIDRISKAIVNKLFISDDERNSKSETQSNGQIKRFNAAYSSF